MVTGPHKINGVPLRRVNQVYVIPTSTRVNLDGVSSDQINDEYFAKTQQKKQSKTEEAFFAVNQTEVYNIDNMMMNINIYIKRNLKKRKKD